MIFIEFHFSLQNSNRKTSELVAPAGHNKRMGFFAVVFNGHKDIFSAHTQSQGKVNHACG